jgi:hypothetical protein
MAIGTLLFAASLGAQTLPVWIWQEREDIYLRDTTGAERVIGKVPMAKRFEPGSASAEYATGAVMRLEQRGESWHIACSNGEGIYYLFSGDKGQTWSMSLVDELTHYSLKEYDLVTGEPKGEFKGLCYMGYLAFDLALDANGSPHIVYSVSGGNYYYDSFAIYAHLDGGKWKTEKVLTPEGYPKRYLGHMAIEVTQQGVPLVVVHSHEQVSTTQNSLSLFTKRKGSWTRQVVTTRNTYAPAMEMELDAKGGIHILATADDVAYYFFSTDGGSTWLEESIKSGNCRFDLALDKQGNPHIAGSCYSDGVYYAVRKGGWRVQACEIRPQMCHAKMILTPEDEPWVAFYSQYHGSTEAILYSIEEGKLERSVPFFAEGSHSSSNWPLAAFVPRVPPPPSATLIAHDERPTLPQDTLVVSTEEVEISVADYMKVDGDTLSVSVNGSWVMEKVPLTGEAQPVRVRLKRGENSIVLYAWNEGLVPPNTAILTVRSAGSAQSSKLKCSLKENAGATLIFR